jgi:hypothetical protein
VLGVAVRDDGGVVITGTERELRTLAQWLVLAARNGRCQPAFAADRGLTTIMIERDVEP